MYALRYTIPFVGNEIAEPIHYRVELWQRLEEGSATPEVVELDGAPSPFEFSLANDDDPMLPIRTSTAKISFVDDIDLVELLPADGFEWRVVLMNADDNTAVFTGYLTGEVFTQPFVEGPNIVTVNAVSPMVPALASTMDIVGRSHLRIGEVIAMAVRLCDNISEVYIPAMYFVDNSVSYAHYTDLLRLRFSAWRYMAMASEPQITGEDYECRTYMDALTDICKLFGWSMVDVGGGALYFVAPGYTGAYMRLAVEELEYNSIFTPRLQYPNVTPSDELEAVDAGDTVEVRQGYRAVSITADVEESATQIANVSSQVKRWSYTRESVEVEIFTDGAWRKYTAEVGKKVAMLTNGNVTLPRYRGTGSGTVSSVVWELVTDGSEDPSRDAFAQYIEIDSCAPKDISAEDGEITKRDWSFQQVFSLKEYAVFNEDDPDNSYSTNLYAWQPLIKMTGSAGLLTGGALVIDFDVRATIKDGFFVPEDGYISGGSIEGEVNGREKKVLPYYWDNRAEVPASLKVGDWWWNGESWVSEFYIFYIPVSPAPGEWHSVATNKTVDMPYSGERGLFIPITSEVQGAIEFCIYAHYKASYEDPRTDIRGLSVSYAERLDYADITGGSSTYYRDFKRSFPNERTLSLPLHSRINSSAQTSLLYKESPNPLDTLRRGSVEAKPEVFLLDDNQRIYASMLRRYRRGAALQSVVPIDVWSHDNGMLLIPTGAAIRYAEGVGEVYLTEIKSM